MARNEEYYPEKVIIVNGVSLGTSLKLIALGAALGSAGTYYLLRKRNGVREAVDEKSHHVKELVSRAVMLTSQVTEFAKSTFPQWQEAVDAAKNAVVDTEQQLHERLDEEELTS